MTVLRYKSGALIADALRGAAGIAFTMGPPLLLDDILAPVAWVLWALSSIFVVYLVRTGLRHKTEIRVTEDGIARVGPLGRRALSWDALGSVRLSYFASARTRAGAGVMALTLKGRDAGGSDTKIVVESSLNGFDTLVETVAALCARPDVAVDPTSVHNFDAFGAPIRKK